MHVYSLLLLCTKHLLSLGVVEGNAGWGALECDEEEYVVLVGELFQRDV